MRERIARHQRDRAERVPGLQTLEEPRELAAAAGPTHSTTHTLVVVDCLTLWLTNLLMPVGDGALDLKQKQALALDWKAQAAHFLIAIEQAPGPVVLVGNADWPGRHSHGPRSARLCRCAGHAQPASGAGVRTRHADGGWLAPDLERTLAMKPTPVRRILMVLAIVLLLLVLMVSLARAQGAAANASPIATGVRVTDDRGRTVALPTGAAAHRQPAAVADRNRLCAGPVCTAWWVCSGYSNYPASVQKLPRWAVGWTPTSRPSWPCGPTWW